MRVVVIAALLLVSSSLCPSLAQEQGKPPVTAPQIVPAQPDQNSQQPRDQRSDRDQPRADDRESGRDWRMRRGDDNRQGRDDREMGPDWRMHRDRDSDWDKDRGRYGERRDRDDRGWDRADRGRDYRGYDGDRPRRRVKVCVEYENGDEYCRYRQGY
jgi:hypothetical protein